MWIDFLLFSGVGFLDLEMGHAWLIRWEFWGQFYWVLLVDLDGIVIS